MSVLTTGDTQPILTGQALSGTVGVNVAGATGVLHIRKPDGTILTKTAVWVDQATGTWSYTWGATDLSIGGAWEVELQITYSDLGVQTFGPTRFRVRTQIA